MMFRVCARWMSEPAEAKDAYQNACVRALLDFRKKGTKWPVNVTARRAYLRTIAKRTCQDMYRWRMRQILEFVGLAPEQGIVAPDPAPYLSSVDIVVRLAEFLASTAGCEELTAVLNLLVLQFTAKEIAERLSLSEEQVERRIARVREIARDKEITPPSKDRH